MTPDKENLEFLNRMLVQVPELSRVYEEHRNIGKRILPHVLMGDITRFVIAQHQNELDSQTRSSILERCLDFLEKGITEEVEEVQELISVSFLENLAQSDALYDSIRSRLGPSLRAELEFYEDEMGEPPKAPQMPDVENATVRNAIRDFFPGRKQD